MKLKLEAKNGSSFEVEVPSSLNFATMEKGERFSLFVWENGCKISVEGMLLGDKRSVLLSNQNVVRLPLLPNRNTIKITPIRPVASKKKVVSKGLGDLKSPMTGKVIGVLVKPSDVVNEGDTLCVIEAMKMENRILAQAKGVVKKVGVAAGDKVNAGDLLLSLEEPAAL
jgi:biotin carboxyl carrier protein